MSRLNTAPYDSPTLTLAKLRISELRSEAEDARLVRTARAARWVPATRRHPAWPAGLVAVLRDSLRTMSSNVTTRGRREACPTC